MNTTRLLLIAFGLAAGSYAADDSTVAKGRAVYQKWCTPCHGPGLGKAGAIAANAHYRGAKPAVLEERTDLTSEQIKNAVRNGVYVMPRFRKTEISNADLDAIVAYLTRAGR
ncbi:MAG TPA: cytochrome c [Bryobacteraceae bacterium]|nr:cytochrome c [Bryobacteraceae bacterium]